LVSDIPKLRERIRQLFDVVRSSLTEELNGGSNGNGPSNGGAPVNADNGYRNGQQGNGQSHSNGHAANGRSANSGNGNARARGATQSQIKALFAITKNQGVDLGQLLRDRFRIQRADDLSLKDASILIDVLK